MRLIESMRWGFDDVETPQQIVEILEQAGARLVEFPGTTAPPVYVVGDEVIEWDGKDLYPDVTDAYRWISDADLDTYFPDYEQKWNDEFWRHPNTLFHETTQENAAKIMVEGLQPQNKTRGLTNTGVGIAIFTTYDYDYADGSYGDTVIEIDTHRLAKDRNRPEAQPEPDVIQGNYREVLARRYLGIEDYDYDYEQGVHETTVILYGSVAAQYLTLAND
jgi:hypothetical protein